jgi:hypothetical protein
VRAPLNWHLAESTALELQKASDNLVQLYKRISLDYDLEEGPRKELLHKLASTAGVAQQTLRPVVPSGYALAHVRQNYHHLTAFKVKTTFKSTVVLIKPKMKILTLTKRRKA